uniref:NLRC4 helical domain n=1 Tax=Siphoviridae sp. cts9W16 TaxID=2823603 RepID=A0A8S5L768_9CAUD|nr:MAG TPA: NLRC4 helical domain [Siphoviridae sp. cts9W16]
MSAKNVFLLHKCLTVRTKNVLLYVSCGFSA